MKKNDAAGLFRHPSGDASNAPGKGDQARPYIRGVRDDRVRTAAIRTWSRSSRPTTIWTSATTGAGRTISASRPSIATWQAISRTASPTWSSPGQNYIYTRPTNFQDANIKGLEAGYSQFLDFLPGFWSGFGFDVNGTYIDAPFNNVAKHHVNASGIYEKAKYSFRFSYTWNSEYLVGPFATGAQPQFTYASIRENADLSFNYRWSERITVSFDATNIFDNYQRQHAGSGSENAAIYPTGLQRFDKTDAVGLRAKW